MRMFPVIIPAQFGCDYYNISLYHCIDIGAVSKQNALARTITRSPYSVFYPSTHTTPWPHFIIDVGLVQRGYSIPSPVLLKCCVASVVA